MKKVFLFCFILFYSASVYSQTTWTITDTRTGLNLLVTEKIVRSFTYNRVSTDSLSITYDLKPLGEWKYPVYFFNPAEKDVIVFRFEEFKRVKIPLDIQFHCYFFDGSDNSLRFTPSPPRLF